jgi:hypothetical protein
LGVEQQQAPGKSLVRVDLLITQERPQEREPPGVFQAQAESFEPHVKRRPNAAVSERVLDVQPPGLLNDGQHTERSAESLP